MRVLQEIQYPDMDILCYQEGIGTWFLRVRQPHSIDNATGLPMGWQGRPWRLSQWMTDGEIVQMAFKAILTAMEHEIRERFTYKGHAVLDGHYDIDKLVSLRAQEDSIKGREPI